MNTVIDLMKSHSSVRRFKEEDIKEEDLRAILPAGQMASSWKNFQSYSIILVRSQEKKEALYQFVPQEAIRQSSVFLLFVGDLNRAEKGVRMHTDQFHPEGPDNLLITSVDAALAGQNTLLAAESLATEASLLAWFGMKRLKWLNYLIYQTIPILSLGWL